MPDDRSGAAQPATALEPEGPGITWEPGDEDYPFAANPGESALTYFQRWLDEAGYARIERDGATFIHAVDVANVVNHITVDVELLRGRLEEFGDQLLTAADHVATVDHVERALAELREVLVVLRNPGRTAR
jgi:hypothetical protein